MAKVRTKKIVITGCGQCTHIEQKQSPYTGDSFDMIDVDVWCNKAKRCIDVSCRPWEVTKILKVIPDWCPL